MKSTTLTKGDRARNPSARAPFLDDLIAGLGRTQKEISCKYFYDEHGSDLFDQICDLDEYYPTRTELSILRDHAPEMAHELGEDIALIELGSGSSLKTRLLLAALRTPRAYIPVDISAEHMVRSAGSLADTFPGLRIMPVAADFTENLPIPHTGDPRARRVVYFPGSTIGNFQPRAARRLLRRIAEMVGPGGGLLIGFDLDKDPAVLIPAYNDRLGVTAEFNRNVLIRANRELGADFDLDAFEHRAVHVPEHERIEMHLVSLKPQAVTVGPATFDFAEGETILTEYSHKYSLEHIRAMTDDAGWSLGRQWLDPLGYFAVQHLTVA
ncbi:L-histidine N(alpha)-methyltransferase [Isosphaeraceae bacterium EP7]